MKNLIKLSIWCLLFSAFAVSCGTDGPDGPKGGTGSLVSKSCANREDISGEEQDFKITIETDGSWKAALSRDYATLDKTEGGTGTHELNIHFNRNNYGDTRSLVLSLTFGDGSSVTVCQIRQAPANGSSTDSTPDPEGCRLLDSYMDSHYLWNEAYRQTDKNYNQSVEYFLDDVLNQMYKKGENLLDGCYTYYGQWYWAFYSYVAKNDPLAGFYSSKSDTRAATRMAMPTSGYGLELGLTSDDYGDPVFYVLWVYPESPAAKTYASNPSLGRIERGDLIYKVNGTKLTVSNYLDLYYEYFYGAHSGTKTATISVPTYDETNRPIYNDATDKRVELTTGTYYETPVLFSQIYYLNGHTVGYMVYTAFDSDYESDLLDVLNKFASAGVTDVVLDLRYNGGGSVDLAVKMASSIAGVADSAGKVFCYQRHNDERLAQEGGTKGDYTTYSKVLFNETVAAMYNIGAQSVYVIGTDDTASASELIISSLRGIDKTVKVVGVTKGTKYGNDPSVPYTNLNACTNGKNVGMEVLNRSIGAVTYSLVPITFQLYNAKGLSDEYAEGFEPDVVPRINLEGYLPWDWGAFGIYSEDVVDSTTGETHKKNEIAAVDYLVYALQDINGGKAFTYDEISWNGKSGSTAGKLSVDDRNAVKTFSLDRMPRQMPGVLRRFPQNDWRKTNMYIMLDEDDVE